MRDVSPHKFPVFSVDPFFHLSLPSVFCPLSTSMARTSGGLPLWKETPSTNMNKARLLEIANAKEARIVHLLRKNSKCWTFTSTSPTLLTDFYFNFTEARKVALRDVRAALAAAQATNIGAQPPTIVTLIPKPRGTSGRGGFNLAKEMGVDPKTSRQIQVSTTFISLSIYSSCLQNFIRTLINMSALDKTISWKNQPGDEVHKIFTVVCLFTPTGISFTDATLLDRRKISNYEEIPVQLGDG